MKTMHHLDVLFDAELYVPLVVLPILRRHDKVDFEPLGALQTIRDGLRILLHDDCSRLLL